MLFVEDLHEKDHLYMLQFIYVDLREIVKLFYFLDVAKKKKKLSHCLFFIFLIVY